MPAAKKTYALAAATLTLSALCVWFLMASDADAQESFEPQTLRIPTDARGLNDAPYRTTSARSGSANQSQPTAAPIANEATGEQPASFVPRTPADNALVPWNKALRPEENLPNNNQSKSEPKRLVKSKDAATLALRRPGSEEPATKARGPSAGLGTMFISLFLVLGLFFLAAWMLKRGLPKSATLLPSEVVEVLGRAPLGGKQHMHLLRVGNKMLLVALTAGGAETLTEITDPLEVDRLAGLCQQQNPHSSTNAFKQIFQQFARRGDAELPDDPPTARGRLATREVQHG